MSKSIYTPSFKSKKLVILILRKIPFKDQRLVKALVFKVVITWSRFACIKFQPVQPGHISLYHYMRKSIFTPASWDRFPPGIWLQRPIDSHWFTNFHKKMKLYKDIYLLFSHNLTSYASQKLNRNNYDLLKCTSIDFFKLMC